MAEHIRWIPRWDDKLLIVPETITRLLGLPLDGPIQTLRLVTLRTHAEALQIAEEWRGDLDGEVGAVIWPDTGIDDDSLCWVREARELLRTLQ